MQIYTSTSFPMAIQLLNDMMRHSFGSYAVPQRRSGSDAREPIVLASIIKLTSSDLHPVSGQAVMSDGHGERER